MALEFSTAGVTVKYAVEANPGTRPTSGYTQLPNIKSTPDFNPEPSNLDVTDLSDTVWKRYIPGLKDPGGAIALTANMTAAFKTAWETMKTAADTAWGSGLNCWFEICVPSFFSFYFAGRPSELGINALEVDAVLEESVYITPNVIEGWASSSS